MQLSQIVQLVERRTLDPLVVGSNPALRTKMLYLIHETNELVYIDSEGSMCNSKLIFVYKHEFFSLVERFSSSHWDFVITNFNIQLISLYEL